MESIFLLMLVFLAILAAVDLFVGVSNDAVNFLNSAIGSRIASFVAVVNLVRSNFFGKKKEESSFDIVADNTDKDSIRANISASVDESINTEGLSMRSSDLYLNCLQFARAFINRLTIVALLERDLNDACRRDAARREEAAATPAQA